MIRVNLLPLKETERAVGRRQQLSLAALGLSLALLIMVVPFVMQGRRMSAIDRESVEIQEQIKRFNEQVKEVHELERLQSDLETKLRIIEDLNAKRSGPARVLTDLSVATPENLWLLSFNEASGAATLTGLALDNETIARFMRQLQSSPYFFGVDLVETSRNIQQGRVRGADTLTPLQLTRFIIKARIDYFGRAGKVVEPPAKAGPAEKAPAPEKGKSRKKAKP